MRGRIEPARELVAEARRLLEEVALTVWMAGPLTQMAGWVELLADEPATAERALRWGADTLRELGELAWLPTVDGILAEALYAQGRYTEAEDVVRTSEETAGSDDLYSQGLLRGVHAKSRARAGDADAAERLAREAIAVADETDFPFLHGFARACLAEVAQVGGRADDAEAAAREAAEVWERKGYTVGARRVRALVES
jgi:tetratricopeptide (TPR) repeat protein